MLFVPPTASASERFVPPLMARKIQHLSHIMSTDKISYIVLKKCSSSHANEENIALEVGEDDRNRNNEHSLACVYFSLFTLAYVLAPTVWLRVHWFYV